jgi:hypothetical protein
MWRPDSASRPSIEDLADAPRVLHLKHDRLADQMLPLLRRFTPITALYGAVNIAAIGYAILIASRAAKPQLAVAIETAGMFVSFLALLPVHEAIHGAAYKWFGHQGIAVRYQLRQLTAYCVADKAVVSSREFAWVALAPFLLLNTALLAGTLATTGVVQQLLVGALVFHVIATAGDVAMVNFLWRHRTQRLYTWDDMSAGESHFVVVPEPR